MPGFTNAGKDRMLAASRAAITHVSLHDGNPGSNGTNELSGGSYARQTVTLTEPSDGEMFVNNAPQFEVPPDGEVRYVGFWAGSTFEGSSEVTEEIYSENGGTYTVLNTTRLDLNG